MATSALSMNLNLNGVAPPRFSPLSSAVSAKIGTVRNNFIDPNLPFSSSASICIGSRTTHVNRPMPTGATGSFRLPDSSSLTFDVVVVGAGIIGLTIARHFLLQSNLSVALVDAAVPCAGATGAGFNIEFDAVRIHILGKEDLPSLHEAISIIRTEEGRRSVMLEDHA